jgi:hypothetical protein
MARGRKSMICVVVVVDAFVDLVLLLIYEPIEIPRDGVLCFVLACYWLSSSSSSTPSSSRPSHHVSNSKYHPNDGKIDVSRHTHVLKTKPWHQKKRRTMLLGREATVNQPHHRSWCMKCDV